MIYGVFLGLAGFFKTRDEKTAITDDFTFRLFYGFTSGILFLCTTLIGVTEISGNLKKWFLCQSTTQLFSIHKINFRSQHWMLFDCRNASKSCKSILLGIGNKAYHPRLFQSVRIALIFFFSFHFRTFSKFRDDAVVRHFEDRGCDCLNEKWVDIRGNDCSDSMVHSYYQWVPYVLMIQVKVILPFEPKNLSMINCRI